MDITAGFTELRISLAEAHDKLRQTKDAFEVAEAQAEQRAIDAGLAGGKNIEERQRKRRFWKIFYITSGRQFHDLASVWKSFGADPKHKMVFEDGIGLIETNLPTDQLRDLFRAAGVPFPRDYTTDSKPSWEKESDSTANGDGEQGKNSK